MWSAIPDNEPEEEERGSALTRLLLERLRREGQITFAAFMETALYHPEHGYYCAGREPIGAPGDYYTSIEVHPLFGEMVTRQLHQMWQGLGSPHEFAVVEMGAGKGLLCHDISLSAARIDDSFARALRYHIVEPWPALVARQRQLLAARQETITIAWHASLADLGRESIEGCFLSNELIDAFPVHQVALQDGALREVYVTAPDDRLTEAVGPLSSPALAAYFAALGMTLAEGQRAEVNLRAIDWMRQVGRALRRGFVLTIDYGYQAAELFGPRHHRGTLLAYHRHRVSEDLFARIGRQDITAHVDFTTLMRTGEEAGLSLAGLTTQSRFLLGLGIMARGEEMIAGDGLTLQEALDLKRAIGRLIHPGGLGKFHVLIQCKGMERPPHLDGLALQP